MKLVRDIAKYKKIIEENINNEMVKKRIKRNIEHDGVTISKENFWRKFIICLITTQAKSGHDTPVNKFIKSKDKIFSIDFCLNENDILNIANRTLRDNGLRMNNKNAKFIHDAITQFKQKNFWLDISTQLKTIEDDTSLEKERAVADYIREKFKGKGIGLKQSRNLIQMMGLSKYVVPLDSRVIETLNSISEIQINPRDLSNIKLYNSIEDEIQKLCENLKIEPCIFDACVFSSFN